MSPFIRSTVLVAGAILVSLLGAVLTVIWASTREQPTPLSPMNTTGPAGRALVVYHPGLSDFPDRITAAFARGLIGAGWRVDRTTASEEALADLADYDLLVLGSPVYANAPAMPLVHYLERLGDLGGKPVALVFTAAGDAGPALATSAEEIARRHGRVVGRFGYITQKPNAPTPGDFGGSNTAQAVAMAHQAGEALRVADP
ncbi:MAG TPA: hypothetical protein VIN58_21735 [Roseateles sp.]